MRKHAEHFKAQYYIYGVCVEDFEKTASEHYITTEYRLKMVVFQVDGNTNSRTFG